MQKGLKKDTWKALVLFINVKNTICNNILQYKFLKRWRRQWSHVQDKLSGEQTEQVWWNSGGGAENKRDEDRCRGAERTLSWPVESRQYLYMHVTLPVLTVHPPWECSQFRGGPYQIVLINSLEHNFPYLAKKHNVCFKISFSSIL